MSFVGRLGLGVEEIARLRLAEAGALQCAAERLEGIHVRHEGEVAKPRADQLRQRGSSPARTTDDLPLPDAPSTSRTLLALSCASRLLMS